MIQKWQEGVKIRSIDVGDWHRNGGGDGHQRSDPDIISLDAFGYTLPLMGISAPPLRAHGSHGSRLAGCALGSTDKLSPEQLSINQENPTGRRTNEPEDALASILLASPVRSEPQRCTSSIW